MSNIFLENDLNNIFEGLTENSVSLPQFVSIIDRVNKTDNNLTSSAAVQLGGALSVTSANSQSQDVNKLISMLTSESSSAKLLSETSTGSLEDQLKHILNQDGGANKKKTRKQKGGDDTNVESIKQFFAKLKSKGVNVDVKLNDQTMTEFFGLAQDTTTEMPVANDTLDVKKILGTEENPQAGGAKKKGSKKATKKDMDGGVNPGFQAFLDLKKHVATKLGISNGPAAAKVAGAVQKDMKEKYPNLDAVNIAKKGQEHFDQNMEHYKRMLPK